MDVWAGQLRGYRKACDKKYAAQTAAKKIPLNVGARNKSPDKQHPVFPSPADANQIDQGDPKVSSKDLQKCVNLLAQMLDKDGGAVVTKRAPTPKPNSRVQKSRVIVKSKAKPVRARHVSATRRRSPPKSPVLREQILAESDSEDEIPVRDGAIRIPFAGVDTDMNSTASTIKFDTTKRPLEPFHPSGVQPGTPYNSRLPSSTPCATPTQENKPGHRGILKLPTGTRSEIQNLPLNSSDQVRQLQPPPPAPVPVLSQGLVQFKAHPPTGTVSISQPGSSQSEAGPGQYSLYTEKAGQGSSQSEAGPGQYSLYTESDTSGLAQSLPHPVHKSVLTPAENMASSMPPPSRYTIETLATRYTNPNLTSNIPPVSSYSTGGDRVPSSIPADSRYTTGEQSSTPVTSSYATVIKEQTEGLADKYRHLTPEDLRRTFQAYVNQPRINTTSQSLSRATSQSQSAGTPGVASSEMTSSARATYPDKPETGTQTSVMETPSGEKTAKLSSACKHCEHCPSAKQSSCETSPSSIIRHVAKAKSETKPVKVASKTNVKPALKNKKVQFNGKNGKKSGVVKPRRKISDVSSKAVKGSASEDVDSPRFPPEIPTPQPPAKVSSPQAKSHLQTLKYLLKELKAVAGLNQDVEVERLTSEIEQTASAFVPGLGGIDWRTEMDLAVQPFRSENAQLRRQLRIMRQQLKDQGHIIENAEKPDPNFQIIHLDMQNKVLEKKLADDREAREKLREQVRHLQGEMKTMEEARGNMINIMNTKDQDLLSAQQDLVNQVRSLKLTNDKTQLEKSRMTRQLGLSDGEIQMLRISLEQREAEVEKLQHLVRQLQMSMTRVLHDLQAPQTTVSPHSVRSVHSGLQMIEEAMDETHLPDTQVKSSLSSSPAKRVLNFDQGGRDGFSELPQHTSPLRGSAPPPAPSSFLNRSPPDMNSSVSTDYLLPYGMSPIAARLKHSPYGAQGQGQGMTSNPNNQVLTPNSRAMTVKDFLTPLASKLSPHKGSPLMPPSGGDLDPYNIPGVVPLERPASPPSQHPIPAGDEGDSTLVEGDEGKTPDTSGSGPHSSSATTRQTTSSYTTTSELQSMTSSAFAHTELDTSLSTIPDVISIGTVTSTTSLNSVSSMEDQAFQDGLATLDANIARIQKQLRHSITQH